MKVLKYIDYNEMFFITVEGAVLGKRLNITVSVYKKYDSISKRVYIFEKFVSKPLFKSQSWEKKSLRIEEKLINQAKSYCTEQWRNCQMTEGLYDSLDKRN